MFSAVAPYSGNSPTPAMGPFPPAFIDAALAASPVSASGVVTGPLTGLLENDPWKNSVTAELPFTFVISLGREVEIHSLQFVWGNGANFGTAFKVDAVDVDGVGGVYQSVANVSGVTGQVQYIPVTAQGIKAAFLRITVTQASAPGPVVLQQVSVLATPPTALQAILLDPTNRNTVIYSATDPNNPLSIFDLPITRAMQLVGQNILAGLGTLTDHQKVVAFMNFLNSARIGDPSSADPETSLLENIGACGNWSDILAAFAVTQGLQARIVDLFNYPWMPGSNAFSGHTVTEIFINGEWEMYDPTYGVFFTTDPDNSLNPHVLSFADLQAGMGGDPGVTRILGNPERLALGGAPALDFISPAIYQAANPSGVIGPDHPMTFPMSLDLNSKPAITAADFGANQGAWILGSAFVNVSQLFTLTGLVAGQTYSFTASYSGYGGLLDGNTQFDAFSQISGGSMLAGDSYTYLFGPSNAPWNITFTAAAGSVQLFLSHAYMQPLYLYAASYTLSPVAALA